MEAKDIVRALNNIDDRYLIEAEEYKPKKKFNFMPVLGLAFTCVLVMACMPLLQPKAAQAPEMMAARPEAVEEEVMYSTNTVTEDKAAGSVMPMAEYDGKKYIPSSYTIDDIKGEMVEIDVNDVSGIEADKAYVSDTYLIVYTNNDILVYEEYDQ
mgnify:FL=1